MSIKVAAWFAVSVAVCVAIVVTQSAIPLIAFGFCAILAGD